MDDEKLAHFQSATGLEDMAACVRILESHDWDLEAAVSATVNLTRYSNDHGSTTAGPVGLAQLAADRNQQQQEQEQQQQQQRQLITSGNSSGGGGGGGGLVWKVVTLPISVIRGGASVVSGALGLGVWVVGSVLSYSLGAVGLGGGAAPGGGRSQSPAAELVQRLEAEYGERHPLFQTTGFMDALRRAGREFKLLFVYLHSAEHVDTPAFCRDTLCSDAVVDFIDANFVAWAADVRSSEGFQMSTSLKASAFPFCALVMPASNQRIALLQQVEGPKSPEELVALLQKVLDDHSPLLVAARLDEEERRRNRQLRDEQDAAYQAALQTDRERETKRAEEAAELARQAEQAERERLEAEAAAERAAKEAAEREAALEQLRKEKALSLGEEPEKGPGVTQVQVRFPSGERKERRFGPSATVQSVYDFVDSLGCLPTSSNYSLVSNFPRTVYGPDTLGSSLKDAGLHPHAALFVQPESS